MNVDVTGNIPSGTTSSEIAEYASNILQRESVDGDSVLVVSFVDVAEIAELNDAHMGKPGPTDVLSFPIEDAAPGVPPVRPADGPPLELGDIFICTDVVVEHAHEYGATLDDELHLMVTHGVLHILGWDHQTEQEAEAMEAREAEHLATVGRVRR